MVDCTTLHVIAKVFLVQAFKLVWNGVHIDSNQHSSPQTSPFKTSVCRSVSVICSFGDSSHLCAIFKLQKHKTRKVKSHYLEECSYLKADAFLSGPRPFGDSKSELSAQSMFCLKGFTFQTGSDSFFELENLNKAIKITLCDNSNNAFSLSLSYCV